MTSDTYRILTPTEYISLWDACPKTKHRVLLDCMLNTGMRYSELLAFMDNLMWFDAKNRAISLPDSYAKTNTSRVIHLTPTFTKMLSHYLKEYKTLDFPDRRGMDRNLKRWWWNQDGKKWAPMPDDEVTAWYPTVKTFRKTWESWLIFAGYDPMKVALSQGHTTIIQMHHYANMTARLKSEVEQVKKMTEGWMT